MDPLGAKLGGHEQNGAVSSKTAWIPDQKPWQPVRLSLQDVFLRIKIHSAPVFSQPQNNLSWATSIMAKS